MKNQFNSTGMLLAACALLISAFNPPLLNSTVYAQTSSGVPRPDHVVIVIEENRSYSQIINSSSAPYINSLADQGALFTQSFGIGHPSEPNYLELFSGSNQGVTTDACPLSFSTPNLGAELFASGFSFGGYSEDLPSVGYTGCSNLEYMRKHNPWVNFDRAPNAVPAASNMPFDGYWPSSNFSSLPTVSIVVPSELNDMHDGTILQGDTWLRANIDPYVQWAQTHNSLLILTFDEDNGSMNNQIATVFVGPMVAAGQYGEHINHYNVLRTVEDMYGLAYAGASATAKPITDCWTGSQPSSNPIDQASFFVRQHYGDFLNRKPDTGGLTYWTDQIAGNANNNPPTCAGGDTNCLNTRRTNISDAFFVELEFQQTGAFVYRLYRAAYGNNQPFPNPSADPNFPVENLKMPGYQVFSRDHAQVPGGPNLAQEQLALANSFVQRPEFITKYPVSLATADQFVDAMLVTLQSIGVNLSSERVNLISLYGSLGRGGVMYRLADDNAETNPINNQAFIDAEYNREFVFAEYAGYLRRDSDIAGFLFWLGQVNNGPLRDIGKQHAMVCSFITSLEYQQRFAVFATRDNTSCPQ